jgi:hypothetical protein
MKSLLLFTDGSAHPTSRIGYGAYLALSDLNADSQNIIGLPDRRERMEKQDYRSKTGTLLNHAALYQEFFSLTDSLDDTLVKVKGHWRAHQKTPIDQLFTLVDRASRQTLRAELANP